MAKRKLILVGLVLAYLVIVGGFSPGTGDSALSSGSALVACTMDAKICPDGSAVGRTGPNCEFAPCPEDSTSSGGGQTEIANPASVKCIREGGKLAIKEADGGQIGICHFPDGTSCEEWAYYRGECGTNSGGEISLPTTLIQPIDSACARIALLRQELAKYRELVSLTENELSSRGYSLEKLKLIISEKEKLVREKISECPESSETGGTSTSSSGGSGQGVLQSGDGCLEIQNRIQKYKEILLLNDELLSEKGLAREKIKALLDAEAGKYSACLGANRATETLPAVPVLTPCGEAKGLSENVLYYKKLLSLTDEELAEKGLERALVQKKFEQADATHNNAVSNCVVTKAEPISSEAVPIGPCEQVRLVEQKILYYKKLLGLTDSELAERVKEYTRENLKANLESLEKTYAEFVRKCRAASGETRAQPCVPSQEKMREYEGLSEKLKAANANGDKALAEEIMQEIRAVKAEIAASNSCAQEISAAAIAKPTAVENSQEISSYYKNKLATVMSSASGVDSQISSLKELRTEIDKMIEALLKRKESVDAEELSGLATVEISEDGMKVNNKVVESLVSNEIVTRINNREMKVLKGASGVSLDDGSEIKPDVGEPVIVEDGKVNIGGNELKILPGELGTLIGFAPDSVELGSEDGKLVYVARMNEKRKLFWIIPVQVEKTEKIDAENGESLGESMPWWSALASR
ncbi:MAG: DUF333 domain-containing protein [archaeon]